MRLVIGLTGASGSIYGVRLLEVLAKHGCMVHLLLTDNARLVARHELGWEPPAEPSKLQAHCVEKFGFSPGALRVEALRDLTSPVASGSYKVDAVILCPASTGRIAAVAQGQSRDLLERTCDVALKEGRKLIVVPRETPLSEVQLKNLWTLARMGVHVLPASPGFYHKPKTVDDLVNFVVGRILNLLDIPHTLFTPWGGTV